MKVKYFNETEDVLNRSIKIQNKNDYYFFVCEKEKKKTTLSRKQNPFCSIKLS